MLVQASWQILYLKPKLFNVSSILLANSKASNLNSPAKYEPLAVIVRRLEAHIAILRLLHWTKTEAFQHVKCGVLLLILMKHLSGCFDFCEVLLESIKKH